MTRSTWRGQRQRGEAAHDADEDEDENVANTAIDLVERQCVVRLLHQHRTYHPDLNGLE